MDTIRIGASLFRELFYELVGDYEYQFNRNISKELKYDRIEGESSLVIPVYGKVVLPRYIRFLLLHPIVSRLSEIRQLAHTYIFLPGATHSRLEHSIGVMHRCTEILKKVREKGLIENITKDDEVILQIAALLHDLGHPAWGHALDGVTGHIVQLLKEVDVYLFSQKKLDIAITTYLLLHNEQLKKALEYCYEREVSSHIISDSNKFRMVVAQIIAEEEYPLFDELNNETIMEKVHYLTTILGTYKGIKGINADRLDWTIRDYHHAGVHEQLDETVRDEFEKFIDDNKNNNFEIEIKNGRYLVISGEFGVKMDNLRNEVYKAVYEGLERAFIDSFLTRLAYAVVSVINKIGDRIASPTTKMRAVMGYLLMPDYLMKEYTMKILGMAREHSHLIGGGELENTFIFKSSMLSGLFGYMPYLLQSLRNPIEKQNYRFRVNFDCIDLGALGKTILIVPAETLSEILRGVIGATVGENNGSLMAKLYSIIMSARVDPFRTFNIPQIEQRIQSEISEILYNTNCYILINYYFFRRLDDEFRKKIKNIGNLYTILKKDLKRTPFIFVILDRILTDEKWDEVTSIVYSTIYDHLGNLIA